MKNPIKMLNDIVAQISEGNTLLEMIYKNTEEMNEETDCGLACLIRSFDKTRETAYAYIEELAKNDKLHHEVNCENISNNSSAEASKELTSYGLNSWATDIENCKAAVCNAMDCIPQELSAIGMLAMVFEKLDELQEIISKKADKIDS